jgi:crotonobetainyl-CoA:carnitine CoA-transferase CaiB-like acyl-CoA transferase
MTAQALAGLRILDLTGGIAGPLGVLQLAEHGADVIKIEPPGGAPTRLGTASTVYNRSRRSVVLDLKQSDGVTVFRELLATADVVVEAFAPGTMARLGLDYEALHDEFPRLVYCAIPAWPSGVRYQDAPGYEALVHARTGQQWENTSFRSGPVFLHSPVASFGAAFLVPMGIMAALLARDRTGRGQRVEISLLQGVLSLTTQIWNWTDKGQYNLAKSHPGGVHQASIFECANGEWIHAATTSGMTPTRSEASILGVKEYTMAESFALPPEERAVYAASRVEAFKQWDRQELLEALHEAGLGGEAIVAPHERFDHPQLRATAGAVVEVDDPDHGLTTQIGPIFFLNGTPGAVQGPQPRVGEHTDEVLRSLGHDDDRITALRAKGVI